MAHRAACSRGHFDMGTTRPVRTHRDGYRMHYRGVASTVGAAPALGGGPGMSLLTGFFKELPLQDFKKAPSPARD
jgi:hypothetical protein